MHQCVSVCVDVGLEGKVKFYVFHVFVLIIYCPPVDPFSYKEKDILLLLHHSYVHIYNTIHTTYIHKHDFDTLYFQFHFL